MKGWDDVFVPDRAVRAGHDHPALMRALGDPRIYRSKRNVRPGTARFHPKTRPPEPVLDVRYHNGSNSQDGFPKVVVWEADRNGKDVRESIPVANAQEAIEVAHAWLLMNWPEYEGELALWVINTP